MYRLIKSQPANAIFSTLEIPPTTAATSTPGSETGSFPGIERNGKDRPSTYQQVCLISLLGEVFISAHPVNVKEWIDMNGQLDL